MIQALLGVGAFPYSMTALNDTPHWYCRLTEVWIPAVLSGILTGVGAGIRASIRWSDRWRRYSRRAG